MTSEHHCKAAYRFCALAITDAATHSRMDIIPEVLVQIARIALELEQAGAVPGLNGSNGHQK